MVELPEFRTLDKHEYATNAGRINDVKRLNQVLADISKTMATEELVGKFNAIRLPCAKIQNVAEVIEDPLVKPTLLKSRDPKTGTRLTLAPPPYSTPFLDENENTLSFPPTIPRAQRRDLRSPWVERQGSGALDK